jgi:hypothetical protein
LPVITPPQRVPPRLGLSIALRGLKAADERKCEHAQERLAQNHGSRLTPALIKHVGCRDLKATKIPCFQLTPVSNECLNFYRQFETAVSLTCIPALVSGNASSYELSSRVGVSGSRAKFLAHDARCAGRHRGRLDCRWRCGFFLGWAVGRPNVGRGAHIGAAYSPRVNFGQCASSCPTESPAAAPKGVHRSFVG